MGQRDYDMFRQAAERLARGDYRRREGRRVLHNICSLPPNRYRRFLRNARPMDKHYKILLLLCAHGSGGKKGTCQSSMKERNAAPRRHDLVEWIDNLTQGKEVIDTCNTVSCKSVFCASLSRLAAVHAIAARPWWVGPLLSETTRRRPRDAQRADTKCPSIPHIPQKENKREALTSAGNGLSGVSYSVGVNYFRTTERRAGT